MNRYFKFFVMIIIGVLFLFSGCKNDNEVTGVTIFPSVCVLRVGETKQLDHIVTPDNADDKTVRWTIQTKELIAPPNADAVASISENGKVAGLAEGLATAVCITNSMFYEATAKIMVGYAAAVHGQYIGSLSKDGVVIDNKAARMTLSRIAENEACLYYYPLAEETISCDVTVKYVSDRMEFSGINPGSTKTVEAKGSVTLYGVGDFEVVVSDGDVVTTYSFMGVNQR